MKYTCTLRLVKFFIIVMRIDYAVSEKCLNLSLDIWIILLIYIRSRLYHNYDWQNLSSTYYQKILLYLLFKLFSFFDHFFKHLSFFSRLKSHPFLNNVYFRCLFSLSNLHTITHNSVCHKFLIMQQTHHCYCDQVSIIKCYKKSHLIECKRYESYHSKKSTCRTCDFELKLISALMKSLKEKENSEKNEKRKWDVEIFILDKLN